MKFGAWGSKGEGLGRSGLKVFFQAATCSTVLFETAELQPTKASLRRQACTSGLGSGMKLKAPGGSRNLATGVICQLAL